MRKGIKTKKNFGKKFSRKDTRNDQDLIKANKIINKNQTIEKTLELANVYGEKAKEDLSIFPDTKIKKGLINLVNLSLIRDH